MRYQRLGSVVNRLESVYGLRRHGNVRDAFWELVYILFSIRTAERSYKSAFRAFRKRFHSLSEVADARISRLERSMRPLGLSRLRAKQLRMIARSIRHDLGARGLNRLGRSDPRALETYLLQFHGVGAKIAKCVAMYAFDAPSLPVDTHVWRVMSRLGFARGGRLTERKALELEARVPETLRYAVHVLSISHGRAICRSKPLCERCVLADLCPSRVTIKSDTYLTASPTSEQATVARSSRLPGKPISSRC